MPEIFHAKVRDLSHKGLGVVDYDGKTFFCRGTWPGDEGKFEIPENAEKYTEARLIELTVSSPDRVEPPCPHRGTLPGQCGGCNWMMASYQSQLHYKTKRLLHALEKRKVRYGDSALKPMIPSPVTQGYRNRVQLKTDGHDMGYVSENTSVFAPVYDCLILNPRLRRLFHEVKASLPREDYRPSPGYKWNYIDLDDEMNVDDVQLNKRRPFRQGNTDQNEVMRKWVRDSFDRLPRHFPIIDLFCGSGNFTEVLSSMGFTNILAVEVQGTALKTLETSHLPGVRILPLDMNAKGSWAQVARHQPHAKAILIDPPREGLEKRRGLFKYLDNLQTIFYISCELDTYSRDVSDLTRNGWDLTELLPVDLFPHTPHVEICSVLERHGLSNK